MSSELPTDFPGKYLYTETEQISASRFGTMVQRGRGTLAAGVAFIAFPVAYLSSTQAPSNLEVFMTPRANNPIYFSSFALAGISPTLSSVSGCSVSGSGTDTFFWLSLGERAR